jgi:hypothetical protein
MERKMALSTVVCRHAVVFLAASLLWAGIHAAEATRKATTGGPLEDEAKLLCFLPEDTETVEAQREPFELTSREFGPQGLLGGMTSLLGEGGVKALQGQKVRLVMAGSRNFGKPTGIPGEIVYEGCQILLLDKEIPDKGAAFLAAVGRAASGRGKAGGVALHWFRTEKEAVTLSVALPKPDMVCLGMGRRYLEETLERTERPGGRPALPEELPEWKVLDYEATCWAIRHYDRERYDRERANKDPTSLLGPNFLSGTKKDKIDPQAVGVVYQLNRKKSELGTVTHLSRNPRADEIVKSIWVHDQKGLKGQVTRVDAGTVVFSPEKVSDEDGTEFVWVLGWILGHGVLP